MKSQDSDKKRVFKTLHIIVWKEFGFTMWIKREEMREWDEGGYASWSPGRKMERNSGPEGLAHEATTAQWDAPLRTILALLPIASPSFALAAHCASVMHSVTDSSILAYLSRQGYLQKNNSCMLKLLQAETTTKMHQTQGADIELRLCNFPPLVSARFCSSG